MIVDAHGTPARKPESKIDEKMIKILTHHKERMDALDMQDFKLSLFTEFCMLRIVDSLEKINGKLAELTGNSELDVTLDLDGFGTWADERMAQMREEVVAAKAAEAEPAIDLSEEG